jgi:putative hydrolase of the HAD superfamily
MSRIRAIIFDIDDTLYPERDYVLSGYRAVADAFAGRLGEADAVHARMVALFDTPQRGRVFNVLADEAGATADEADALVAAMITTYRTHAPAIMLEQDVVAVLEALRGRYRLGRYPMAISACKSARRPRYDFPNGWMRSSSPTHSGREFWKPHPRAFEAMADRLGVAADACAYVGDNLAKDFVAPNALGWLSVLLERPGRVHAGNQPPPAARRNALSRRWRNFRRSSQIDISPSVTAS